MKLIFLIASLALSVGPLPFPAPKLIQATDALRSDVGTVFSVDPVKFEMKMNAPGGQITYKTQEVQVVGPDGRALGTAAVLKPGQNVRVYYVVQNGAIAKEIDIQS